MYIAVGGVDLRSFFTGVFILQIYTYFILLMIVFTNKIRVHVWPKSGKINIFGSKAELTGVLIREFIRDVFHARWSDLICDTPIC